MKFCVDFFQPSKLLLIPQDQAQSLPPLRSLFQAEKAMFSSISPFVIVTAETAAIL